MKTEALKPCPFCGGEAALNTMRTRCKDTIRLNGQDEFHGVNCILCGANTRGLVGQKTTEQAAHKWNTRHHAPDARLVEALQGLVTLVKEGFGDYESGELVQAEAALKAAGTKTQDRSV